LLPPHLSNLKLIPARELSANIGSAPGEPGVYLFFLAGGMELLGATSYFETGSPRPLTVHGRQHLYTGAALHSLRHRVYANLRADVTSSSLCRSLLAIERARRAISKSCTPGCKQVRGEQSIAAWLCKNAVVGIEETRDPYNRERELLAQLASPLNIVHRRDRPYARALSAWRCAAFPADIPESARRVRYR
jgi:hypothetical protein